MRMSHSQTAYLREAQRAAGMFDHQLIQSNATRWSSVANATERLLEKRPATEGRTRPMIGRAPAAITGIWSSPRTNASIRTPSVTYAIYSPCSIPFESSPQFFRRSLAQLVGGACHLQATHAGRAYFGAHIMMEVDAIMPVARLVMVIKTPKK